MHMIDGLWNKLWKGGRWEERGERREAMQGGVGWGGGGGCEGGPLFFGDLGGDGFGAGSLPSP
jgi:hypothetical protein